MRIFQFKNNDDLETSLSLRITEYLSLTLKNKNSASLLLSGGKTPVGLFRNLGKINLNWERIKISMVDERMVDPESDYSNIKMLKKEFYSYIDQNNKPVIYPLNNYYENPEKNIETAIQFSLEIGVPDIVVLGMGLDGHFASLFPNDNNSAKALDEKCTDSLTYTLAPNYPEKRISFTWPFLMKSKLIILHICGKEKLELINDKSRNKILPISKILDNENLNLEIYYTD